MTASVYAQTGDIVLATVMYRDVNILGYPLGWTLLFDSDPTKINPSLNHKFAFIILPITADGDVSATFTQTLNGRMIVHLITIKNVENITHDNYYTKYFEEEGINRFVNLPQKEK